MKQLYALLLIITATSGLIAQEEPHDSVKVLEPFSITSSRLTHFTAGTKQIVFDTDVMQQYMQQSLAELLSSESPLYVKSYGQGAIASVSFRGTNAQHTAVLWNGININNPMNGQMDFSLLPVGFYNNVSIQYGGNSALWGSGAIGGAIHLNNKPVFNKGESIKLALGTGSFGAMKQSADVMLSKKKLYSSLKLYNSVAQNNFSYTNEFLSSKPLLKQQNAEVSGKGLMSETHVLLNNNQKVNFLFWYQKTDRSIPPAMLEQQSKAHQSDGNLKLSSEWTYIQNKITAFVRGAYFSDKQRYNDSISQVYATNKYVSAIGEGELKVDWTKNHHSNFGLNNTYVAAKATNMPSGPKQNNTALFASHAYSGVSEKLRINLSLRQEWMQNLKIPMTYSAGASYKLLKTTDLNAQVARVHRLPTLNDLYWEPGGNPNLLPEEGYTLETGLKWQYNYKNIAFSFAPSVFSSRINNWIIWLPEGHIWKPQNIMEVWSRGMESLSEIKIRKNDTRLGFSVLTNYVLSGNQKPRSVNDNSLDKQLIYIPMYSGYAKIEAGFKKWQLAYRQNYTGYRYTSSDNTQYLEPYTTAAIYMAYSAVLKKTELMFFAQCQNVFNAVYQVVAYRPMPLRHYSFGITISFNKSIQ